MRYYRQNTAVGAYLGASDSFWLQQTTYLGHVSPSGGSAFISFAERIFRLPASDSMLISRLCELRKLLVTFANSLDQDQAHLFIYSMIFFFFFENLVFIKQISSNDKNV